jgi:predicted DsbA family dithiol-disulfide isomerase
MSDDRITVYSDYVCPFCYLGRQSLDRYQAEREEELEVDWRPFDLRSGKRRADGTIDHSVDDGKDDDYFERAKQNVRRLQDQYDVDMTQEVATDVDSLPAQVVSYYLKEEHPYETWLAFDETVFEALWTDGEDIGDEDLLVELASEAGVDESAVRSALADDELRSTLEAQFREAKNRGVSGVPTFAYDGHAARGAVPPAQIRRLVEGT